MFQYYFALFLANHFSVFSPSRNKSTSFYPRRSWLGIGAINTNLLGSVCNSYFLFLSPVSSPSPTTVDLVPPNEQPSPQTRSITNSPPASPTTNVLIKNSIPFSAVYPEPEDEPLRTTNTSWQNVRPLVLLPRHPKSQHHSESVALQTKLKRAFCLSGQSSWKASNQSSFALQT